MSTEPSRQYGLILPKKGLAQDIIQRPAIFDERSDSGGSGNEGGDWLKKTRQKVSLKPVDKKQINKALSQDPTIYQYDEVYDDIKVKKVEPKKEEKKQSRYIQSLKRHAERRKLENERRQERQVQKERQAEGEEFKDKETFVTSSYKKKLEEIQKLDEEEKRMDRLEEIGDVSKQKDLSGFYRHLYKTTVDVENPVDKKDTTEEKGKEKGNNAAFKISKSPPSEPLTSVDKPDNDESHQKKKRQYRKRTKSGSSKEEGEKTTSSSSSSSSSYSSSSSSDSEDIISKKKKKERKDEKREKIPEKKKIHLKEKENKGPLFKNNVIEDKIENKKTKIENANDNINKKGGEGKSDTLSNITINIWLKRTVGENFDTALQRYLERKSKKKGA